MTYRYWKYLLCAALSTSAAGAHAESLESFSAKCDAAIGVTVPDFVCDAGTLVPTTDGGVSVTATTARRNSQNAIICDRPNVLNEECDPGSKFQVLINNASSYVVAHCRKRGDGQGLFKDIAVIQHNRVNGATCFYQALRSGLSGDVKAPSKGTSVYPWLPPAETAGIGCAACHDNGPIIRSPYLAQVTGPNRLPGAGDTSFNSNQPYTFVGDDFSSWRTYKVEVAGNTCNNCHRMGVNNVGTIGTARDLSYRATNVTQLSINSEQRGTLQRKNPHSTTSPIWMLPGQNLFSQAIFDAGKQIRDCANSFNEAMPLPSTSSCRISLFGQAFAPSTPPQPRPPLPPWFPAIL